MSVFIPGQRWISESEPELGLGTIVQASPERVQVEFKAAGETRIYAAGQAPLKRVRFRAGDRITTDTDQEFVVQEVVERAGLLTYLGPGQTLPEARVSDRISLQGPEERLLAGHFGTSAAFALRVRTWEGLHRWRKSPVLGFVGGRIDLIPHQLYIAQEVTNRHAPRVLLSDEVGLGKTIEACLILHRLRLSGRAQRILVLVPESLVHQWFVEMLRRFNLWLHIFDAERCTAIEAGEPDANPFLDDQLVLTSIGFLAGDPRRAAQAVAASWDMLVVDEAHHLEWSPAGPSREYLVVEALSRQSAGLLLLTATPEQLGVESHFARLRLLDPDRYRDLATFQAESKDYQAAAGLADKLRNETPFTKPDLVTLRRLLAHDPLMAARLASLDQGEIPCPLNLPADHEPSNRSAEHPLGPMAGILKRAEAVLGTPVHGEFPCLPDLLTTHEPASKTRTRTRMSPAPEIHGEAKARAALLDNLLDLHGPGRVLFRNTRAGMKGFPKRTVHLACLEAGPEAEHWLDRVSTEFAADAGDAGLESPLDLARDPRLLWLVELLRRLEPQKVLLIGRTLEKAEAIDEALRRHLTLKTGIFHEGLTLVQRDRNAAWFAEPEGARLLLCSEIGSEGRNFQFAHHLVLFDLPLNPELLEQRIGRLDRIGQAQDIHIHVPFLARSPQEILARWYHEGLDAFETNLEGSEELLRRFGRAVHDLALEFPVADHAEADREFARLRQQTMTARREIRQRLEEGRDRLLELNSFRPAIAQKIIGQIREQDQQPDLEDYLLDVFDHFGVHVEELAPHTWQLNPHGVITDAFPALPAEGMVATCDRRRALGREDVAFLTWDHPLVTGAMDLLLGGGTGNCGFAILPTASDRTLLLECLFVLEVIAAPRLHADRFLPPTPIRLIISHKLADLTETFRDPSWEQQLVKGSPFKLIENADIVRRTLPAMLQKAASLAEARAAALRESAMQEMNQLLGHEVERLEALMRVNDHVRPQEIELARQEQAELAAVLQAGRVRLDAVRMIWRGSPEVLSG